MSRTLETLLARPESLSGSDELFLPPNKFRQYDLIRMRIPLFLDFGSGFLAEMDCPQKENAYKILEL